MSNDASAKSIIREKAFQALFLLASRFEFSTEDAIMQTLYSGIQPEEVEKPSAKDLLRLNMPKAYRSDRIINDSYEFLQDLIAGVRNHSDSIDQTISKHLKNRSIDRIETSNLIALRLAVYELNSENDVAPSIVLDEAIELTKRFNDDKSGKFVNGVLQSVLNDFNTQ